MRFWVRFSRNIFKILAFPLLNKIRPKTIESVLKKSINLLNDEMVDEIRTFIRKKQTAEGGFADRAGKSDLYYSLFGYFLAEAFSLPEVNNSLNEFIKKSISEDNISGVNLYCAVILYTKLNGIDNHTHNLEKRLLAEFNKSQEKQPVYSKFMGLLALYYLGNFLAIRRLIKGNISIKSGKELPCPVIAATTILNKIAGLPYSSGEAKLKSFLQKSGGFKAIRKAPEEDMLSTGVALYALNFINADIRLIKPDCLSFIDDLYDNGGFRATQTDFEADIEYTFYALLGLGSLQ